MFRSMRMSVSFVHTNYFLLICSEAGTTIQAAGTYGGAYLTMRIKLLSCEVFFREVCLLAASSPNTCDLEFLPKGLHDLGVEKMRERLQGYIDLADAKQYDAIVLVYGLCNNGVAGLKARHTRIVIPKAHDCISLFLGSRARYREQFNAHPGTYYRTTGWLEHADSEGAGDVSVSQKLGLFMQREELVMKYGEENADYIQETMGDGMANYDRLAFISMGMDCEDKFRSMAVDEAAQQGLVFEEITGSMELLRKLIRGEWDDDFLVVEPGQILQPSHDDAVIKAKNA
ncbi:MAG: DUF1638 domain-containing protein [bacterium]